VAAISATRTSAPGRKPPERQAWKAVKMQTTPSMMVVCGQPDVIVR
jgi:hypothetical protein